jgi:hypothetical protein
MQEVLEQALRASAGNRLTPECFPMKVRTVVKDGI